METVLKVCKKQVIPKANLVNYPNYIEDAIFSIKEYLQNFKIIPKRLLRWISLKVLDGDKNIIKSIEENFNIPLINNEKLDSIRKKALYNIQKENKENLKDIIVSSIVNICEDVFCSVCTYIDNNYSNKDKKIDKILTSKVFGFPIMILFLGIIFWITIVGANYPSEILFSFFSWIQEKLILFANFIDCPSWLSHMLINGVYQTLTWIISVMLPPMAIFFPLFTFLEDLGYLPRIAFNVDGFFKKCSCSGKQMITMCMGFGCNSAGVTGCRIINSPREKLIAILTNNFIPCNR